MPHEYSITISPYVFMVSPSLHKVPMAAFVSIEDVMAAVLEYTGLTYEQLVSKRRHSDLVRARQIVVYILKEGAQRDFYSLKTIGERLGDQDHSTVINAHKMACKRMLTDDGFVLMVNKVQAILRSKTIKESEESKANNQ